MTEKEYRYYTEEIVTGYFIKFAILAFASLVLFGFSSVLPRETAVIVISSVLTSATLIVIFVTLFTYWTQFRMAVVLFERNIKMVTLKILFACLLVALLALAAILLS